MSDRLERLKDELIAIVDGDPGREGDKDDTGGESEFKHSRRGRQELAG